MTHAYAPNNHTDPPQYKYGYIIRFFLMRRIKNRAESCGGLRFLSLVLMRSQKCRRRFLCRFCRQSGCQVLSTFFLFDSNNSRFLNVSFLSTENFLVNLKLSFKFLSFNILKKSKYKCLSIRMMFEKIE